MLDEKTFTIKESFVEDVVGLQRRFRCGQVLHECLNAQQHQQSAYCALSASQGLERGTSSSSIRCALVRELLRHPGTQVCLSVRRRMAVANLVLAPFLLAFLLIYFFMRNAERLYHQPSAAGARRWSPLAAWRLREFNELPHYTAHRRAFACPCGLHALEMAWVCLCLCFGENAAGSFSL